MQFIVNTWGTEGKAYSLVRPNWVIPTKLREELLAAKVGRICSADVSIRHELTGEACGAIPPNSLGGMSCDDLWAVQVASEWPTASLGVWLCGQGHAPVGITEDICPSSGCSVQKLHLSEVAARYWITVASDKEEVTPVSAETYDSSVAAAHFATVFGSSRCGSHMVGWRGSHSSDTACPDCGFLDVMDDPDEYVDSDDGALQMDIVDELDIAPANVFDNGAEENGDDQAEPVGGSKPIWRYPLFSSKNKILFVDLCDRALAEGMDHAFVGTHMRTFDIRDACWIHILQKATAEGDPGEFAAMLPKACTEATEDRVNARLQYCIKASRDLPPGVSTKRHSFSTTNIPPNTHVARKRSSDGQCDAPPEKISRKFLMSPQDFVNCVSSFMAATLSKSAESIAPLQVAESVLARYKAKESGSKDNQTCPVQADVPKTVEHPQPAQPETNNNTESESNKNTPHSMSEDPIEGPSPKPGLSSRQKGMAYQPSSHKSIISKPPISKPSYKNEQKSKTIRPTSYQFSPKASKCGSQYGPGLFCEQLREPWMRWCKACEKRSWGSNYNTRSGFRGGPRGGPPRGGHHGGGRGNRGGRRGGRGSGHGNGIAV